jgi:hypothetical protein
VDSPHLCVICGERIRKNNQSYRGFIPVEMIAAIRREKPSFHVRQDICLACGKKFFDAVSAKAKKPAWMLRPLG